MEDEVVLNIQRDSLKRKSLLVSKQVGYLDNQI